MLNLNSFMMGTEDPKKLGAFYEKVVGKKPDMAEEGWVGFVVGSCFLGIGLHDKVKGMSKNPERVIFNFETNEVKKEFERIRKLGATVIKEPYAIDPKQPNVLIATFADPDGNYFQLMSPWDEGK